ncbi:MAG: GNAT family N-acetyltransferase [Acidobacteria bacterium]|nr:GNAT family N-acetyltransferase [Acidobacteriota bacterium]
MWWRTTEAEFSRGVGSGARKGAGNRRALKRIVDSGRVPGLLAYVGGRPVGWCSVAPREEFGRLERSRTLARVDDCSVWSIVCFFVDRAHRGEGVGSALLRAAVRHATRRGARIVEGYPVEGGTRAPATASYMGLRSMFEEAGFREVARRGARPIMRYVARGRGAEAAGARSPSEARGGRT